MNVSTPVNVDDYENPLVQSQWIDEQQAKVVRYLRTEHVRHGGVAEAPTWFLAPHVSLWAVAQRQSEALGCWVVAGDLPTDFVDARNLPTARQALRAVAERWYHLASAMQREVAHPEFSVQGVNNKVDAGTRLQHTAAVLQQMAEDDGLWA